MKPAKRFSYLETDSPANLPSGPEPNQPTTAEEYFSRGDELYYSGNFEEALRIYARALGIDPAFERAWLGQVKSLVEMGEYPQAGVWANKGIERFPQSAALLSAKAVVLARQGMVERAIGFSDSSLQVSGDSPFVWISRGQVFLAARNPSGADHCFTKAFEGRDRDWQLHMEAGRIYLAAGEPDRAQLHFELVTQINPKNAFAWWNLGLCLERTVHTDRAKECFQKAVKLDPYQDLFHNTLKRFKQENGLFGWLLTHIRKWSGR